MAYCGVNDIRRGLTGSATAGGPSHGGGATNTAADLDDHALQDAADEATSVVDSYIDGPYDTTVDEIPAAVRYWTRDIAAYLATLVWRKSKAPAAQDPVVLRYNHAMKMLDGVAAGTITIIGPENPEDQPTVINNFGLGGNLIRPDEFDLFGRSEGSDGWPIYRRGGELFWAGTD